MQMTVDIPDELIGAMAAHGADVSRKLLEDLTAQAYRDGRLTTHQVQSILELPSRMHVDPFLLKYGIFDYTVQMLEQDLNHLEIARG